VEALYQFAVANSGVLIGKLNAVPEWEMSPATMGSVLEEVSGMF